MFLKKLRKRELNNYESELDKHRHHDDEDLHAYDAGTIQGKAIWGLVINFHKVIWRC